MSVQRARLELEQIRRLAALQPGSTSDPWMKSSKIFRTLVTESMASAIAAPSSGDRVFRYTIAASWKSDQAGLTNRAWYSATILRTTRGSLVVVISRYACANPSGRGSP